MYFNAKVSVVINGKELQTVVSVSAKNDSGQIGSHCELVVPMISRYKAVDDKGDYTTELTRVAFVVGDPILIKAMYVGYDWVTVFQGYVYDIIEGTPTRIKCIDEVYWLNQNVINVHYAKIGFQALMDVVLAGTGIKIVEPKMDFQLEKITFRYMSPAAVLEWFRKELFLNVNLTGKNLYINIASNTTNIVRLATGMEGNVLKCDLQRPDAIFHKIKVKVWFTNGNGTKTFYEAGDEEGQLIESSMFNIPNDAKVRQEKTDQALVKARQRHYSGTLETMLYPDCDLYAKVIFEYGRFPQLNGNYTIQSVEIDLNEKGYRRKLKLAYLDETDIVDGKRI